MTSATTNVRRWADQHLPPAAAEKAKEATRPYARPNWPRYLGGPVMSAARFRRYIMLAHVSLNAIMAVYLSDWRYKSIIERGKTYAEKQQERLAKARVLAGRA